MEMSRNRGECCAAKLADAPPSQAWQRIRPLGSEHMWAKVLNSLMMSRDVAETSNIVDNARESVDDAIQYKLIFGKFVI